MFCFPILDHVMLLEGIVSFKMLSCACANVRITNEKNKRKIPMRASHGLKWENKMYKLRGLLVILLLTSNMLTVFLIFQTH